jgi:hypothetical protein
MSYDEKRKYHDEDILLKMRAHNLRIQEVFRRRNEQILKTRQPAEIQIVPHQPGESKFPTMLRGVIEKMRQTRGNFRLLHFTIQLGRLRIEFSQAKGTVEATGTGGA